MAREAAKPDSTRHNIIVSEILQDHISAINFSSKELAARLERDLTLVCQELKDFLAKLPKCSVLEARDEDEAVKDEVVSVGEKLSALFLAALLEDCGLQTQYVDLSHIINFEIKDGRLSQDFYSNLAKVIGEKILLCGDSIPILTGFFGTVPGGLLANCGRGYSDLCAALAAVGSDARELQVWKEVSGVYTAWVESANETLLSFS